MKEKILKSEKYVIYVQQKGKGRDPVTRTIKCNERGNLGKGAKPIGQPLFNCDKAILSMDIGRTITETSKLLKNEFPCERRK